MLETCQKKKTAEIRNPAFHGLGFVPNGKVNYRRSCNGSLYHMDTLSTSVSPYGRKKTGAERIFICPEMGVSIVMGGTLKYGWFISVKISWKIPIQNGFFWGVALFQETSRCPYHLCVYILLPVLSFL